MPADDKTMLRNKLSESLGQLGELVEQLVPLQTYDRRQVLHQWNCVIKLKDEVLLLKSDYYIISPTPAWDYSLTDPRWHRGWERIAVLLRKNEQQPEKASHIMEDMATILQEMDTSAYQLSQIAYRQYYKSGVLSSDVINLRSTDHLRLNENNKRLMSAIRVFIHAVEDLRKHGLVAE